MNSVRKTALMKRTPPAAPAGPLALVTIGLERILLPSAAAQKMLPLLEKGISVREYYNGELHCHMYRDAEPLRIQYRAADRSELQLDQFGPPGRDEEPV